MPAFTFDAAGANKSTELLGKHVGMFKADATPINVNIKLGDLVMQSLTVVVAKETE